MASLGIVYGLCLAGQLLGQSLIMKPDIAAWAPLMFGGTLCAWLTGTIRT
jgi:lipopolysaccharide export system permease protein